MTSLKKLLNLVRAHGGYLNSTRILFRKIETSGISGALVKLLQLVSLDHDEKWARDSQRWYQRHKVDEPSRAGEIFQRPFVLIVGPMDLPQCKKYRIVQKLEIFKSNGIDAEISHFMDAPRVFNLMQMATHILFYRTTDSQLIQNYLAEARRLGLRVGYDIDDPIFDRETYSANPNLQTLSRRERKHLVKSSADYLLAMKEAEFLTVSTPGMAALASSQVDAPVHVWRNLLDGETLSIAEDLLEQPHPASESVKICYMSGSRAHDTDFDIVATTLADIMRAYPQVELLIGGYFQLPKCLEDFEGRIEELPFSGYGGYLGNIYRADINIVPLVIDGFNECKSAIRYLEAAILGVPTIASATGDFKQCVEHGVSGYLAQSSAEWREYLDLLVSDSELRTQTGKAAQEQVEREQSVRSLPATVKDCLAAINSMDIPQ